MMALLLSLEVTANVPSDAAVDRQTSSVQLLEDGTRTCKHYLEGLWVMSIYHTARRDRRSRRSFQSRCVQYFPQAFAVVYGVVTGFPNAVVAMITRVPMMTGAVLQRVM